MDKCNIKSFSKNHVVYSSDFKNIIAEKGVFGSYYDPIIFNKPQDEYRVFFEDDFRLRCIATNGVSTTIFSITNGELIIA